MLSKAYVEDNPFIAGTCPRKFSLTAKKKDKDFWWKQSNKVYRLIQTQLRHISKIPSLKREHSPNKKERMFILKMRTVMNYEYAEKKHDMGKNIIRERGSP